MLGLHTSVHVTFGSIDTHARTPVKRCHLSRTESDLRISFALTLVLSRCAPSWISSYASRGTVEDVHVHHARVRSGAVIFVTWDVAA